MFQTYDFAYDHSRLDFDEHVHFKFNYKIIISRTWTWIRDEMDVLFNVDCQELYFYGEPQTKVGSSEEIKTRLNTETPSDFISRENSKWVEEFKKLTVLFYSRAQTIMLENSPNA